MVVVNLHYSRGVRPTCRPGDKGRPGARRCGPANDDGGSSRRPNWLAKTGMRCDEGFRIRHLSWFMGAILIGSFPDHGRQ